MNLYIVCILPYFNLLLKILVWSIGMSRRFYTFFLFVIALMGALIYFREYISAINEGFWNFILTCGDFGQYSYEALTYFRQKFIFNILVPDKEPGIFLVTTILTHIIWLSSSVSLLLVTFISQFISLFVIWSLGRKLTWRKLYWIIGILVAVTAFQLSYVYLQLISRQLFSTTFLLLASNIYFFSQKTIPRIFLISLFLSMSFISHRFGGIIALGAIIFWLSFRAIKFHKVNYSYLITIFIIILMTLPFIYFLWKYAFIVNNSKGDIFLSELLNFKKNTFNWGFSYLASSSEINEVPLVHYFFYQPFYLIFVCAHLLRLVKYLKKWNLLFIDIFLMLLIYSLIKVTFSIRSLVSFEIFLIPIIALSFYLNKNKLYKLLIFFLFVLIWIYWVSWRIPMTFNKVILKDSSISYIQTNFEPGNDIFLSLNRCDSEILTQLFYLTSENLGNDNLDWINYIWEKDILSYAFAKVIAQRNYNTLISGRPYLHEIFRWKGVYIFFWKYTNQLVINSLKNRSHPIFQVPYFSLVYEDPQAKIVRYIFKLDISKMNFFDNGYYLRDIKSF